MIFRIGFENQLALQIAGLRSEFSFRIHWRHDRRGHSEADLVILLAVAGGDVYAAGALILSDELAEDHSGIAIKPGMAADNAFELGAGPCLGAHLIIFRVETNAFITLGISS